MVTDMYRLVEDKLSSTAQHHQLPPAMVPPERSETPQNPREHSSTEPGHTKLSEPV
jgi:hypothetical protein